MARTKTSAKRKASGRASLTVHIPFTSPELKDSKLVIETLIDCIRTGDLDAFRDVLWSHVMTTNRTDLARKAGISRRTLYALLDTKKKFNPELSTVSAIIRALSAA